MSRKKISMTVKHLLGKTAVNHSVTLYKSEVEGPFHLVDEFLHKLGFT